MSELPQLEVSEEVRARTIERFERFRKVWDSNECMRALYAGWYGRIREALPPAELGPWVEIGSGPGFSKKFIPELVLTDLVKAPWHDHCVSAEKLPFDNGSLGALVMFDVLHHLRAPARFLAEASRTLRVGGRLVMCEPYISPVSHVVYKLFHPESLNMDIVPLAEHGPVDKDPFDSNQAIPTLLCRPAGRRTLEGLFPTLKVRRFERLAGLSYPASGGFYHRPLIAPRFWHLLLALEDKLPASAYRLFGFRLLAVIERVPSPAVKEASR